MGMMERQDSTPLLADIHVPTLVMVGEDDQIIPRSEVDMMQAEISTSELVLLPQAGHLLNLEQSEMFNDALSSFINSSL